MTQRGLRNITIAALIMALLWCSAILTCLSHAELPEGMHMASIVREDTVFKLDSLDSIWLERSKADLKKIGKMGKR